MKTKKSKTEFPFKSEPAHPEAKSWGDGKEAIHSGGRGRNAGMQMPKGVCKESGKP